MQKYDFFHNKPAPDWIEEDSDGLSKIPALYAERGNYLNLLIFDRIFCKSDYPCERKRIKA